MPRPLPGHELAYPEIHQACADAGVPLHDRYGWALSEDQIKQAVTAARTGNSIKAGVDELDEQIWVHGFEVCPDGSDHPADDEQLRTIVRILRSPVADPAAAP